MAKDQSHDLLNHFFRHDYGKLVSRLTARYGGHQLEIVEDAVQEAMLKGMKQWSYKGVPHNPTGWLFTVANNRILDQLRRQQKTLYSNQIPEALFKDNFSENQEPFDDDLIKMMFACCTPAIKQEYQIILTLKILGGLSVSEIAAALLKTEQNIARTYTRAKEKFRNTHDRIDFPQLENLTNRLDNVLLVLYLMFNEGYKSSSGNEVIKKDLCEDAMRLNYILLGNAKTNTINTRALMAIMHFQFSRFESRIDGQGDIVPFETVDRSQWDPDHIRLGNQYLSTLPPDSSNRYILEAALCGLHANSPDYTATPWDSILSVYNQLIRINNNPITQLNRIVALSKAESITMAWNSLALLPSETYDQFYLYHAVKTDLLYQLENYEEAKFSLAKALLLCSNDSEKRFLVRKYPKLEVLAS